MDAERARLAIRLLDLTNLDERCTVADVDVLCQRAVAAGTAAVCVWPDFVRQSTEALADAEIAVATVVNFPTGDERPHAVRVVTERALDDGADDVDVVLPYRAFHAGDLTWCHDLLGEVRAATAGRAHMKVIIETGELPGHHQMTAAARFAIDNGADFVKTSTGKTPVSATPDAVDALLSAIHGSDRLVGLKPSGGISTAEGADAYLTQAETVMGSEYLAPSTFRFGASSLLDALLVVVDG
jgi:deoxyribose-phosphate aldolase